MTAKIHEPDSLSKALKAAHSVSYGHWKTLPIIAIGPKGGKIVGYAKGEPIYAGSSQATKLLAMHPHEVAEQFHPPAHELLDFGASMAAGDKDPHTAGISSFPADLSTLTEVPAGKYAGSHGNKLFLAPNGKKFIFKSENPTIARAEEAVSRISRLILGPGKTQEAKYVQLNGKDGVLIGAIETAVPLGPEHKTTPPALHQMQNHFEDLIGQHILDWVTSNHDAHGENFLLGGNGLVGIDKGQAWKFIGDDQLSVDYNPNASTQVYSFFWKAVKAGQIKGDPRPALKKVFSNLAEISEDQFKGIIAPYVAFRAGKDQVPASEIEAKLVQRFKEARSNWEWFLGKIYPKEAQGGKFEIKVAAPVAAPPVEPGPAPKAVVDPTVSATIEVGKGDASGPLPVGSKVTITKKGHASSVSLHALKGGKYKLEMEGHVDTFWESASAAGDHVWVTGQGYKDVADYKVKTGKKKIASGSGWKYWGMMAGGTGVVTPSESFTLVPSVGLEQLKTGDAVLGMPKKPSVVDDFANMTKEQEDAAAAYAKVVKENIVGSPLPKVVNPTSPATFAAMDDGSVIIYQSKNPYAGEKVVFKKKGAGWISTTTTLSAAQMADLGKSKDSEFYEVDVKHPVVAPTSDWKIEAGVSNWKYSPLSQFKNLDFWLALPEGTKVSWPTAAGTMDAELIKNGYNNPWKVTWPNGDVHYKVYSTVMDLATTTVVDDKEIAYLKPEGAKDAPTWQTAKPSFDDDTVLPGEPNWEWFDDLYADLASLPPHGIATELAKLNIGSSVKMHTPASGTVGLMLTGMAMSDLKATKIKPNEWTWIGGNADANHVSDGELADVISTYAVGGKKVQKAKALGQVSAPVVGPQLKPTVQNSEQLDKINKLTDKWASEKTPDGLHSIGEKPSGWDAWIPPPGLWVEGKAPPGFGAKKLWFTTAISGYGTKDCHPGPCINFAVLDDTGKVTYEPDNIPASKAAEHLQDLIDKHTGLAHDWYDWKDLFGGAADNHFPVGTTKLDPSFSATTGAPALPASVVLKDKNPLDLTGAAAAQPLTIELPLLEAWENLPEVKQHGTQKLKIKPAASPAYYNICLDKADGLTPEQMVQELKDFATKYGFELPFPGHPKSNYFGAFMSVKTSDVMGKKISVVAPAGSVPPIEAKPNNFETMPEVESDLDKMNLVLELAKHPKKIFASWVKTGKAQPALEALPAGTHLTLGNGDVYEKQAVDFNHWLKVEDGHPIGLASGHGYSNFTISQKIATYKGAIVSAPGGALPKITKAKPPKASTWVPPPKDPKVEEKKLWAQEHKALTAEQTAHLAWWLKQQGFEGHELIARQTKAGDLLLGGSPTLEHEFTKLNAVVPTQTPHGTMFELNWVEVKASTPEATTIKGPDGADYPYGTVFKTTQVYKTLEEQLPHEQGFTKFAPYKGPDPSKYQKTIKIAGVSLAHKMQAETIVNKYNLDTPIIQGSGNTMFFVSDATLKANAGDPELKVVPKIPKQVELPKLKSVGVALGVPNEGQPAPINRDDLGDVDSIIPFRHGYSIRFGQGGILMDGQLRMHRIKLPDGSVVNRFIGELTKDIGALGAKKFHFYSAASTKPDVLFGGEWKEHDYDPDTGVTTMSKDENWEAGTKYTSGSDLPNGASVYAFGVQNKTMKRTFVVDVPVNTSAEQALASAMQKLGVSADQAMAQPDAQDERIMKKLQIFRSHVGANGWNRIAGLGLMSKSREEREALFDGLLKGSIAKKSIDEARIVIGHDGFHHVELDDLDSKLGSDVKGVGTHISYEGIVRAILQGGYGGQGQCLLNGNSRNIDDYGATTSGSQDVLGGGGVGKYFRIVNSNVDSHSGSAAHKPMMVVHPRALKKTNWYAANYDTFGRQEQDVHQRTRAAAMNMTATNNEVMIENVSASDIVGAIVPHQTNKKAMIELFHKAGITEINGCPVEKFIVVGPATSQLKASMAQLPLLQE